jgi:hypothetical protein
MLVRPPGPTFNAQIRFANRGDTQLDTAALMFGAAPVQRVHNRRPYPVFHNAAL